MEALLRTLGGRLQGDFESDHHGHGMITYSACLVLSIARDSRFHGFMLTCQLAVPPCLSISGPLQQESWACMLARNPGYERENGRRN